MRKIIQIALSPGDSETPDMLYCLCDDGTAWRKKVWPFSEWEFIDSSPQEKPQE